MIPGRVLCLTFWLFVLLATFPASISAGITPQLALKRGVIFYLDYDGNSVPDATVPYGEPGDIGLVGDFNGDTISDLALYRNGFWFLSLSNNGTVSQMAAF